MLFEWDDKKELENKQKHDVDFTTAKEAFFDDNRITTFDKDHSTETEKRYFCFGMVEGKILTVRFTLRGNIIRIIGAGYWRKGKAFYDSYHR